MKQRAHRKPLAAPRPAPALRLALGLALGLAAAATLLLAQQTLAQAEPSRSEPQETTDAVAASPSTMGVFSEVVEVNVVNVLVTVTDKEGRPILGLTKDDFEVREDGEVVEISNFYEVQGSDPLAEFVDSDVAPTQRWMPVGEGSDVRPAEIRYMALLIDHTAMERRNRKKVFAGVRDFISKELDSMDRLLVASFDGDYKVLQPFTNSAGDIVSAIDSLEKHPAGGTRIEQSFEQTLRSIEATDLMPAAASGPGGGTVPGMERRVRVESASRALFYQIENQAREGYERGLRSIEAMRYLMSSMAGLPGRKVIVYVSDGLAMRPGQTLFHAHHNYFSAAAEVLAFDFGVPPPEASASRYDLNDELRELAEHAQAQQVTFSAIDGAGIRRSYMVSAGQRRFRDTDSLAVNEYQPAWESRFDGIKTENLQSSLQLLATKTGGSVLLNNRDYGRFFKKVRSSLDNYYSLGYVAPHPKEGGRHDIEVATREEGFKVAHHRGYRDKTWSERLADTTLSHLMLGEGKNPLGVQVIPGVESPREKKFVLPMQILVPLESLTLIPQGEEQVGSVSVLLIIKDEIGNTTNAHTIPLAIRLPGSDSDEFLGQRAEAQINLIVEPGRQEIGVGVRDEIAGAMATTTVPITIGS